MTKITELTKEGFEEILFLLSEDREEAGAKYEQIRAGLLRFFGFRGCSDSELLVDETMSRVAAKIGSYDPSNGTPLTAYFYGFAANVLLEHRRSAKREVSLPENIDFRQRSETDSSLKEAKDKCLSKCMGRLSVEEREMIINYYGYEDGQKLLVRDRLCQKLGCTSGSLYTKVFRVKAVLRGCVEGCLKML